MNHTSFLKKVKKIFPYNHPFNQLMDDYLIPMEQAHKHEKLKKILPPHHPLIKMMEDND